MHIQANANPSFLTFTSKAAYYTHYSARMSFHLAYFGASLLSLTQSLLHLPYSHWEANPGLSFLSLNLNFHANDDVELPCFPHSYFESLPKHSRISSFCSHCLRQSLKIYFKSKTHWIVLPEILKKFLFKTNPMLQLSSL